MTLIENWVIFSVVLVVFTSPIWLMAPLIRMFIRDRRRYRDLKIVVDPPRPRPRDTVRVRVSFTPNQDLLLKSLLADTGFGVAILAKSESLKRNAPRWFEGTVRVRDAPDSIEVRIEDEREPQPRLMIDLKPFSVTIQINPEKARERQQARRTEFTESDRADARAAVRVPAILGLSFVGVFLVASLTVLILSPTHVTTLDSIAMGVKLASTFFLALLVAFFGGAMGSGKEGFVGGLISAPMYSLVGFVVALMLARRTPGTTGLNRFDENLIIFAYLAGFCCWLIIWVRMWKR